MARTPQHANALIEYSEYIEYLVNRTIDYSTKAVLAFGPKGITLE